MSKRAGRKRARSWNGRAYGPDDGLGVKLWVRNIPIARDPAIILTDQLKTIYIEAELDPDRNRKLVSESDPQGLRLVWRDAPFNRANSPLYARHTGR